MKGPTPSGTSPLRCAIYTRKSTEEGLEQEFNSLVAQREAAEAYILSQREHGWIALDQRYDDGGYSGGNVDRPALKRLLEDVRSKRVEVVVVYKVDRLSRSLLDFASIVGLLDRHKVSFVSVTQQFNTNTSLGKLTLNILFSFAQFEREIVSERTRDKICAARRKGKWTGGHPVLGYDLGIRGGKLQVNEIEAERVRKIFSMFLKHRSLTQTLYEIERRGWKTKSWITRAGAESGGKHFTRHTLAFLLSNPLYMGSVRLKHELHPGEQPAIIDLAVWRKASELLKAHPRSTPGAPPQPLDAILRGLLFCEPCGALMTPAYTKKDSVKVRYYTCLSAQKRGWKACPSRSLSAIRIETAVLGQVGLGGSLPGISETALAIHSLVERVTYNGSTGAVVVTLHPVQESQPERFAS